MIIGGDVTANIIINTIKAASEVFHTTCFDVSHMDWHPRCTSQAQDSFSNQLAEPKARALKTEITLAF